MLDVVFIAVIFGMFGVTVLFVRFCEAMLATDQEPMAVTATDHLDDPAVAA